ncbi:unnamed protein product [Lampetra planeri]
MVVQAARVRADALHVCLTHALSTEREEVMGLCIGEVDTSEVVHIYSVIILRRSDKRKDRVEISPEQLSAASTEAEISSPPPRPLAPLHLFPLAQPLAVQSGKPMRVVGWYHSHPHITVWPSHVDVGTQAMYQMMDDCFVGLIFACFSDDKNTKTGRVLLTCFQSMKVPGEEEISRVEIPVHVVPCPTISQMCLESIVELPKSLCEEEQDAYRRVLNLTSLDPITKIHNGTVFTRNLCSQMAYVSGPLLQFLEDRVERNAWRIRELQAEKQKLQEQLEALE